MPFVFQHTEISGGRILKLNNKSLITKGHLLLHQTKKSRQTQKYHQNKKKLP
jgi:hypothetical protein